MAKKERIYHPEKVSIVRQVKVGEGCPHCGARVILMTRKDRRKKSRELGTDIKVGLICIRKSCNVAFLPVPQ